MLTVLLRLVWHVTGEAAIAAARILWGAIQPWSPRHAAKRVFNLNHALDLVIVYPPRNEEPGSVLPRVAGEDFMAMIHVLELANTAGFPTARVRMTSVLPVVGTIQDNPRANLILICCPRSNAMTGTVLEKVRRQYGLDAAFVARTGTTDQPEENVPATGVKPKPEQYIQFAGEPKYSNTWEAEKKLEDSGVQPWQGTMKDWGLIVKCRNPYNETAKVFIIAGIRGIGTWGAAWHLADHVRSVYKQFKDRDFAAVVEVEYANFRIIGARVDKYVALSYLSPPP
jgi:hypothetical protein